MEIQIKHIFILILLFLSFIGLALFEDIVTQLSNPIFSSIDLNQDPFYLNRRHFKAYASQEMIITIENHGVEKALIYINNKEIRVNFTNAKGLISNNITQYLVDGDNNIIFISQIFPNNSYLKVFLPYPTIKNGNPSQVGFSEENLKKIDRLINNEIEKGFPGAVLMIMKNGMIIKNQAYGYSRIYNETGKPLPVFEPMTNQQLFDMASNTKMFAVNIALMNLYSQGICDLHDTLHRYIPKYSGKDSNNQSRETRTILELMTHTAGYCPSLDMYNPDDVPPDLYCTNKSQTTDLLLTKIPFARPEGGYPIYSDFDFMLLGILIESLTNLTLDKYIEEHIYNKLDIHNIMFTPLLKGISPKNIASTAIDGDLYNHTYHFPKIRNYTLRGEVNDNNAYYCMDQISGHAGLFATTEDLAILLQLLLNKGGYGNVKLWNKTIHEHFMESNIYDVSFGWGWRKGAFEQDTAAFSTYSSPLTFGHTGWTGTLTLIDPRYDLAIAYLTNKKHSPFINGSWISDNFNSSRNGNIIQLVYEAMLEYNSSSSSFSSLMIFIIIIIFFL